MNSLLSKFNADMKRIANQSDIRNSLLDEAYEARRKTREQAHARTLRAIWRKWAVA